MGRDQGSPLTVEIALAGAGEEQPGEGAPISHGHRERSQFLFLIAPFAFSEPEQARIKAASQDELAIDFLAESGGHYDPAFVVERVPELSYEHRSPPLYSTSLHLHYQFEARMLSPATLRKYLAIIATLVEQDKKKEGIRPLWVECRTES
jgi:hypothetical protein